MSVPGRVSLCERVSPASLSTCTRACVYVCVALTRARVTHYVRDGLRYILRYTGETKEDDSVTTNQADDLRCAPLEKWGGNFICMGLCQLRDAQTPGGEGEGVRDRDNGKGKRDIRVDRIIERRNERGER